MKEEPHMTLTAACHCGAVKIEAPDLPKQAASCNCTWCHRTGAVWGYYSLDELTITATGPVGDYGPNGMNHHHFCATCGGNTHGFSPDWGSVYNADGTPKEGHQPGSMPSTRIAAVNLRMAPDLDLSSIKIEQMDGRNNW